ncbi:hypothetical protein LZ30DRAFT_821715 [Colletotrichum cereale]|nr:hypothetical protein LZ30DRAFT_821715 [Colletotrichum cereale]
MPCARAREREGRSSSGLRREACQPPWPRKKRRETPTTPTTTTTTTTMPAQARKGPRTFEGDDECRVGASHRQTRRSSSDPCTAAGCALTTATSPASLPHHLRSMCPLTFSSNHGLVCPPWPYTFWPVRVSFSFFFPFLPWPSNPAPVRVR